MQELYMILILKNQYETHYYMTNQGIKYYKAYSRFINNDYIYKRYSSYLPCQEAENLGSDDNPLYSCIKCSELLTTVSSYNQPIKVNDENSKISFCLLRGYITKYYISQYCLEATIQIKNGKEIFNCIICKNKYAIVISSDGNYCEESLSLYRCLVPYCKTCKFHDGNTCEECISDYEVNTLTGTCIKKSTEIPSIIWKIIYDMNKKNHNLKIKLKGRTKSQINEGHSFLVIFTFKKAQRLRNLEGKNDTIKINGLCVTDKDVDKYNNEEQIVDYTCTGNNTNNINLTNYILELIEDGDNQKFLMPSNIKELVYQIIKKYGDLNILEYSDSYFSLNNFGALTFTVSEEKEFFAKNYIFDFTIEGELSDDLTNKKSVNGYLHLYEVDAIVNCVFKQSESDLKAYLTCDFNAQDYKDIKEFSFSYSEISNEDSDIIIYGLYKIRLINGENVEKEISKIASFFEKSATYFIIGGCVLGAIIIGVIIFIIIKKRKRSNMYNNMQESGMKNINMPNMPNMSNMPNMNNMNIIPNMANMANMTNIPNAINMQGNNIDQTISSKRQMKKNGSIKILKNKEKHHKKSMIKKKIKDKLKKKK